jgi:hypothetical protein
MHDIHRIAGHGDLFGQVSQMSEVQHGCLRLILAVDGETEKQDDWKQKRIPPPASISIAEDSRVTRLPEKLRL